MTSPLGIGLSLTQLLMSRRLRSVIPMVKERFHLFHHESAKISSKLIFSFDKSKFTLECRLLMDKLLNSCDPVRVQSQEKMLFFSS